MPDEPVGCGVSVSTRAPPRMASPSTKAAKGTASRRARSDKAIDHSVQKHQAIAADTMSANTASPLRCHRRSPAPTRDASEATIRTEPARPRRTRGGWREPALLMPPICQRGPVLTRRMRRKGDSANPGTYGGKGNPLGTGRRPIGPSSAEARAVFPSDSSGRTGARQAWSDGPTSVRSRIADGGLSLPAAIAKAPPALRHLRMKHR